MEDQDRTGDDRDQLVHLSYRVPVSYARPQRCGRSGVDPVGLLRVRHYLEVRGGLGDLPDLLCQIPEGGRSLGLVMTVILDGYLVAGVPVERRVAPSRVPDNCFRYQSQPLGGDRLCVAFL